MCNFKAIFKRFRTSHNGRQCERITLCVCSFVVIRVCFCLINRSQDTNGQLLLLPLSPSPLSRSRKLTNRWDDDDDEDDDNVVIADDDGGDNDDVDDNDDNEPRRLFQLDSTAAASVNGTQKRKMMT